MRRSGRSRWISVVSLLACFHILLVYGLPIGIVLALMLLLGVLFWRIDMLGAVAITLSLLVATIAFGVLLRLTGFENAVYFRPDEKLSVFDANRGHQLYEKSRRIEMQMPHGDLKAMTREPIGDPRRVVFQTDSYGFRNSADYQGEPYLLVGDSFIVGTGNSQEHILSEQLRRDHGIRAYNLAHPGGLPDYARYLAAFRVVHGDRNRVLLFVFEGNDFGEEEQEKRTGLSRVFNNYYTMFSGTNVYRFTKSLYKRSTRAAGITASRYVTVTELGGRKLAFLTRYVEVTRRAGFEPVASFDRALQEMAPAIERVYFIPTKYRIYHQYLHPGEKLPDAQWIYLESRCRRLGLRCVNLTGPLQEASEALIKKGELTWWRDDSHWNANGIAAAARVVAETLPATAKTASR